MGSAKGEVLALYVGRRLADNIPELLKRFKINEEGYFGTRGKNAHKKKIRNYECDNPGRTASEFAHLAGANPSVIHPLPGKGFTWIMRDGGIVTYRWTSSSDGTPVVELNCKGLPGIASQKIHFIPRKKEVIR